MFIAPRGVPDIAYLATLDLDALTLDIWIVDIFIGT